MKYTDVESVRQVLIDTNRFDVGPCSNVDRTRFSRRDGPITVLEYILKRFQQKGVIQKKISSDGHGYVLQV